MTWLSGADLKILHMKNVSKFWDHWIREYFSPQPKIICNLWNEKLFDFGPLVYETRKCATNITEKSYTRAIVNINIVHRCCKRIMLHTELRVHELSYWSMKIKSVQADQKVNKTLGVCHIFVSENWEKLESGPEISERVTIQPYWIWGLMRNSVLVLVNIICRIPIYMALVIKPALVMIGVNDHKERKIPCINRIGTQIFIWHWMKWSKVSLSLLPPYTVPIFGIIGETFSIYNNRLFIFQVYPFLIYWNELNCC